MHYIFYNIQSSACIMYDMRNVLHNFITYTVLHVIMYNICNALHIFITYNVLH